MTAFLIQRLNVHHWLKTLVLLAGFWALSAGTAMAYFDCNPTTATHTLTPSSSLRSDGNGGGSLVVGSPTNQSVVYVGNIVSSVYCNASGENYELGGVRLLFGNGVYTFAGGALSIEATDRPTYTFSNRTICVEDHNADWRTNSVAPNYGTYWGPDQFIIAMATKWGNGCTVTITTPVIVKTLGTAADTSTPFQIGFNFWSANFGSWPTRLINLAVATTACAVTPSSSTVNLPTVSQLLLKNPGDTAGVQPFSITLSNCSALASGTYIANANWSFTPGATVTTIANSATSPAGNVEIQIRDANNNPIANNATSTIATGITSGTYSANFSARYYATGQATAGNVRGVVTFNMTYQ